MKNIILWLFLATPMFDYGDKVVVTYATYENCNGTVVDNFCTEEKCLYSVRIDSCPDRKLDRKYTLHGLDGKFLRRQK
jgi:hypothetical protein